MKVLVVGGGGTRARAIRFIYMKSARRYDTSGLIEAQYEPGSRKRVLRNLLGIKRKREMDVEEIFNLVVSRTLRSYGR